MKQNDVYKEVKTFHYENVVVRVHIPELTDEERNRRMKEIAHAAGRLIMSKNEK